VGDSQGQVLEVLPTREDYYKSDSWSFSMHQDMLWSISMIRWDCWRKHKGMCRLLEHFLDTGEVTKQPIWPKLFTFRLSDGFHSSTTWWLFRMSWISRLRPYNMMLCSTGPGAWVLTIIVIRIFRRILTHSPNKTFRDQSGIWMSDEFSCSITSQICENWWVSQDVVAQAWWHYHYWCHQHN